MSLHLVDTSTYFFRAYHRLPPTIKLPDGRPAHAIYGLLSTLAKLVRERKVTRIACCLDDVAADEERLALHPGYKAARLVFPDEIEEQFALIPDALAATGLPIAVAKGWEADDVVATLAAEAQGRGEAITIVGVDKDLLQCLRAGDVLFDLAREREIPHAEANVVLGVPAGLTADFLALAGDAVDEIPGVPGVGKKTASLLVNALGGIDAIYRDLARVAKVEGLRGAAKVASKLKEHEAQVRMALALATLKPRAPHGLTPKELEYKGTSAGGRKTLVERFGFERLSERFPKAD